MKRDTKYKKEEKVVNITVVVKNKEKDLRLREFECVFSVIFLLLD